VNDNASLPCLIGRLSRAMIPWFISRYRAGTGPSVNPRRTSPAKCLHSKLGDLQIPTKNESKDWFPRRECEKYDYSRKSTRLFAPDSLHR